MGTGLEGNLGREVMPSNPSSKEAYFFMGTDLWSPVLIVGDLQAPSGVSKTSTYCGAADAGKH